MANRNGMSPTVQVDMRTVGKIVNEEIVELTEDNIVTERPPAYSSESIPAHSEDPLITPKATLDGFYLATKYIATVDYEMSARGVTIVNTWIVPCLAGLDVNVSYLIEPAYLRTEVVRSQLAKDRTVVWVRMSGATTPVAAGRLTDRLVADIVETFFRADTERLRRVRNLGRGT